jgi:DNA-directed RNA polymerase subunit N
MYEEYTKRTSKGEDPKRVMDSLGLKRYCCRQMFMGHVDLLKEVSKFKI